MHKDLYKMVTALTIDHLPLAAAVVFTKMTFLQARNLIFRKKSDPMEP